jgi:acyl-CoA synthetase (AMP-forming)/AMP-acid ligase II
MCQEELPRHKVPVHVEILAQMPLNGALKIDRPSLVRRATQSLAENA